jgi:excisionase family DNA binding protein
MQEIKKRAYQVTEACEYLACSRQTLYRAIARGELDAYYLGTRRYITKESMDRLINESVGRWPEVEDMISDDLAGVRHE